MKPDKTLLLLIRKTLNILILCSFLFAACKKNDDNKTVQNAIVSMNLSDGTSIEKNEIETKYETELVISGIEIPWGMTWLPDGSMLVTERSGVLYHVKGKTKVEITNVPKVVNRGQGGLLDIELHPDYEKNGWLYFTCSVSEGNRGSHTALYRAKLKENTLISVKKLYQGSPNATTSHHFGSRIEFDHKGYLYFSIGDRGGRDENPQSITKDGGKIYRLHDDGRIPSDNPFIKDANAKKAIYSYGHRNPQGMTKNPKTGAIWTHEHGPRGGDEINIIQKGANYGWPIITYGINYNGTKITNETHRDNMKQPLHYWVPSIAPSGMTFVTSNKYPELKNHLLVGSLKFQYLELLKLNKNGNVIKQERLLENIGRVRCVRQGPHGYLYVAVDYEGIFKIIPKKEALKKKRAN